MKDIIRFILKLVQNPIVLAILWFGVAIRGFWVSWTEGLANNYLIFSRSFFHALEQTPLYVEYPKEYFDLFLYGIPFTLLIAPFSIMPTMVGSALWSLCNALLLYFAIKKLEFEKWKTAIIIWLSYNGLYLSVVTQQYNAAVAAFILFTFLCFGESFVDCRHHEQRQDSGSDQTSYNYRGERALYLGTVAVRQGHRQKTE